MEIDNKYKEELFKIHSLEERMKRKFETLDEAERFDKTFTDLLRKQEKETNNYQFDNDELMEYVWLHKNDTGLPVECYADDGGSYKARHHPLWFLMLNGYTDNEKLIPITVEEYPHIDGEYDLKVSNNDLNKVFNFIIQNRELLIELANDKIDSDDFEDNMDTFQYHMAESKDRKVMINEMAKIRADKTGLPTDIWVDESALYVKGQHGPRIKFKAEQGEKQFF